MMLHVSWKQLLAEGIDDGSRKHAACGTELRALVREFAEGSGSRITIDFFDSAANAMAERYAAWTEDQGAELIDAFSSRSWDEGRSVCGRYHREEYRRSTCGREFRRIDEQERTAITEKLSALAESLLPRRAAAQSDGRGAGVRPGSGDVPSPGGGVQDGGEGGTDGAPDTGRSGIGYVDSLLLPYGGRLGGVVGAAMRWPGADDTRNQTLAVLRRVSSYGSGAGGWPATIDSTGGRTTGRDIQHVGARGHIQRTGGADGAAAEQEESVLDDVAAGTDLRNGARNYGSFAPNTAAGGTRAAFGVHDARSVGREPQERLERGDTPASYGWTDATLYPIGTITFERC